MQIAGTANAQKHFVQEKLDALAGLEPVLLEFAPTLLGSRILDGNFTAACVARYPKGWKAATIRPN